MPVRRSSLSLPSILGATVLLASLLPAAPAAAASAAAAPVGTAHAATPIPAAVNATPAPETPAIIVTEILANTTGDDHFEYFEIHNTTAETIDLAAQGFSFAYSYVDSDDLTRDVALTVDEPLVLAAGETAVLWLSYAAGNVNSFALSVAQFRAYHRVGGPTQVVRVTGQNGMANGGDRGIRVLQAGELRTWSHYPSGSMGEDLAVHFRLPAESADPTAPESLTILGLQSERTPGTVLPIALERPTTEPEPPVQGPASNWPIMVTEIAPDNSGVDDFEFFEIHNTTAEAIDLAGYSFAYTYVDAVDRTRDVPLTVAEPTVIEPGETIALWLSYTTTTVDSFARTVDEFRAHWAAPAETRVVRVEGQPGMANGGGRGIRVVHTADDVANWSYYPSGSVGVDLTAHFRIPGDIAAQSMLLLEEAAAPTPGTIKDEALTAPEPDPEPGFDPQPDPSVVTAPLQVTEVLPDSTNVGASDGYEFIEVYNATSEPIDFGDYSINYLYPVDEYSNTQSTRWPAMPADVVIPGGETLVLWIKNGPNNDLNATDFNGMFGTSLTLGEDLVEIFAGGMANSSPRGIEIITNTGHTVNRAYYFMGDTDDTLPDQGIRYAIREDDLTLQRMLGIAPATPGTVQSDQVPAGLMIEAPDTVAPVIGNLTVGQIDPASDFALTFRVTDDVLPRTVTLSLANDVDGEFAPINLSDAGDGTYVHTINAVDLIGKSWFEYAVTATDGTNVTTVETVRIPVTGASTDPVRLNLEEGAFVGGTTTVIAGGDDYPAEIELDVDGEPLETETTLEDEPVFAFEASNTDYYFKNGVRVGDDILHIFDEGTYDAWKTIVTDVPLSYVRQGDELVVSVWAGTKKAPEIDEFENNDDFTIRGLRLILPDGRTLTPHGYDDPARVLQMGDSAGKHDFFDARFTIPEDAFAAVSAEWETTGREDGAAVVTATDAENSAVRTVQVDNTGPQVTTEIVDGSAYQGEIAIDAEIVDAGIGDVTTIATLDAVEIALPHVTSSVDLAAGEHVVTITATDALGNASEYSATFITFEEQPSAGAIAPVEGAEVEAGDVTLQAKVEDPTGDVLDVSFLEGRRVDLSDGDIALQSGTVNDAQDLEREQPETLSDDDVRMLSTADGLASDVTSSAEFPYQLFDVDTGDAADGSLVRVSWTGHADAGATVILYALAADGTSWAEQTRQVTVDEGSFTLQAAVDITAHARDGVVRVLVQHSEGFAGDDLSTRESDVALPHPLDTPRAEYDFTFGWESDTQYYNENAVPDEDRYRHQQAIHSYLLEQREAMNLQYLFHTGDIVDDYDQMYQWENADPEYRRLDEAGLPYGVLAGNHDVGHQLMDYGNYGTYFGEDRFAGNPWYGGSFENNRGHYDLLSAGGIDFIMVYTGWGPGDADIAWMNEVLAQYPDRVAIIAQHEFILTTGGLGEMPQRILDEVVAANPNVKMVFSGHYHSALTRTDQFDDDGDGVAERNVYSMLFDYQGLPEGGQGFLRLLHFDTVGERMIVRTFSPSLEDAANGGALGKHNSDDPTLVNAPQEFELTFEQLGIETGERMLGTDAFSAEILTSNEIASFEGVASGSILSATWPLAEVGERGWYVRTSDPYGAVDFSPVQLFSVLPAPDPGTGGGGDGGSGNPGNGNGNPGNGNPGNGNPGNGNGSGGNGSGGTGTPGEAGGSGPGAGDDALAATGGDVSGLIGWVIAGGLALLLGSGILIRRRIIGTTR
ncbi:metallophosphoesterase [Microbacterium sp.]|uniref:metallophosphoesterase n=1 Tax=Microbacterium sp. TaxID=51671 RepID=UPI00273490CE|nr:lamin tail domain-containing protein [Microbacterium sp.]MDP3949071.1 lamin tail domain-containing protein [Microbacterium sp.]